MHYTYSHITTIFSMSNTQLHWVQLHFSALCIDHHQVVLGLVEQLYSKWGILGAVGGGGTRSCLYNGGWRKLGPHTITIKSLFT